jgi:hypothetical protein
MPFLPPSCRFPPRREGNRDLVPPAGRGNLKEGGEGVGVGGFCLQKAPSVRRTRVADGYPYQKPRRRSHFANTLGAGLDNPRKMCYNRDSRALKGVWQRLN